MEILCKSLRHIKKKKKVQLKKKAKNVNLMNLFYTEATTKLTLNETVPSIKCCA